ncbi:hypothetical protein Aple_063120 [Acrocarpospora pleiomorpha]|uniref:Uncharacterized protein n=1 Tax=Acrocarpospora pleiomorpha TaxID=90975 RepID=A0A5M3XVQ5_9ACTN|nr:hypothetical protein Aple_063120 [Acrocarpospora pleiomorpha]
MSASAPAAIKPIRRLLGVGSPNRVVTTTAPTANAAVVADENAWYALPTLDVNEPPKIPVTKSQIPGNTLEHTTASMIQAAGSRSLAGSTLITVTP